MDRIAMTAMYRLKVNVTIAEYDLVAATCRAIAKGKKITSRKQVVRYLSTLVEEIGTLGLVKCMRKYGHHSPEAYHLLYRFFDISPLEVMTRSSVN